MQEASAFFANLERLKERIAAACSRASRSPDEVELLPVTKNHPHEAVLMAHQAGLTAVGENRVQEATAKKPLCPAGIRWELIGHLQSNKARAALACFDRIQSVDSLKLIHKLEHAAAEAGRSLAIMLQFNTGADPAKFGAEPGEGPALMDAVLKSPHLRVEGLMTIAPLDDNPDTAQRAFDALRELRDTLATRYQLPLQTLSMGMSDDLEQAIAAGSTQIRVGTALFGQRDYT